MRATIAFVIAGLVLVSGQFAAADLVAFYDFAGAGVSSSDADAGSTASDVTVNGIDGPTGGVEDGQVRYVAEDVKGSLASAIAENDYLGFSITAVSNMPTFDTMEFEAWVTHVNANPPDRYQLQVSTDDATYVDVDGTKFVSATKTWETLMFDMSGVTALDAGQTLYLRLYAYGASDSSSFESTRAGLQRNIALTTIPEPASLALIGIGGLLMASRRRA